MEDESKLILTTAEVAEAIYEDYDYSNQTLLVYARSATSFIKQKTGWDFGAETEKEPLAVQCAILYVRMLHFGSDKYNRDYDYSLGIHGILVDLQTIADGRKNSESSEN